MRGDPSRGRCGAGGTLTRIEVGKQNQKLVPALAGNHVARSHRRAQPQRDRLQELVAGAVTKTVVDELEVVEVEEQDGDAAAAARRVSDGHLEMLAKHGPVGKAGEGVMVGEMREPILGLLARRDVEQVPLSVERHALRAWDDHRLVAHPSFAAVGSHDPILAAEVAVAVMGRAEGGHHPVAIFGMHGFFEQVRIGHPLLMGVARDLGVLGTVVDRGGLRIERIHVDGQRQPLDQVAVSLLGFADMDL